MRFVNAEGIQVLHCDHCDIGLGKRPNAQSFLYKVSHTDTQIQSRLAHCFRLPSLLVTFVHYIGQRWVISTLVL